MMDQGLEALLLQTSALAGLLKTRVYPLRARQGWGQKGTGEPPRPYIVYSLLGAESALAAQGSVNFHRVRYDLEIAADRYSEAAAIMAALVGLNGFKGLIGSFRFLLVKVEDRRANYVPPLLGDEAGVMDMKTSLFCVANSA